MRLVVSQDCPKLRGKALRPAPRFRGDSAVLVSRLNGNRVNGRAVGAPIVLKGTHFEQAPALPGLPGSVATQRSGQSG